MDNIKAGKIIEILNECYPDAGCQLNHANPFELLIATILSAQCTDKRVNEVTEKLFSICNVPNDFVKLGEEKLGQVIKSCGLYKNKSENIVSACNKIIENYNGKVPNTMEDLRSLPGVGRKTASVVLSNAFNIPAMPVDTHVFRVSNRIGLTQAANVEKTEKQLMEIIPKENWIKAHHLLIFHGRQTCKARRPDCNKCKIKYYCDFTKAKN
jgi:endonuclease-3